MAPWCDVLLAGDNNWWLHYGDGVDIPAERWAVRAEPQTIERYGLRVIHNQLAGGYNTGSKAIDLAVKLGASAVILLGYDCGSKDDRMHWHEPHADRNPDARKCAIWQRQFEADKLIRRIRKRRVHVVNCSRWTRLRCYPRRKLEEVLNEIHTQAA